MCKAYGVGRHTMRMALAQLVNEGLISRRAGSGTYVEPQDDRRRFYLDRSFTKQIENMGLTPGSRVLTAYSGVVDTTHPLRGKYGGMPYFYLERLRFGDDEPIGLQHTTILTTRCPGIAMYDFEHESLYDVLSLHYRLYITQIDHIVTATTASAEQAELLDLEAGDPLLLVKTRAFMEDGELIELTVSYYRVDKYEYSTTHYVA